MRINKEELISLLDISPPFLMLDEVVEVDPGNFAISTKNVTSDDWFMPCHIRSAPVMPGALLAETMLQTLMIPIYLARYHQDRGMVSKFEVKLSRKIDAKSTPALLTTTANINSHKRGITLGSAVIRRGEETIASAKIEHVIPSLLPLPS